ncbi:hypothetical protein SmB9_07350 [Sphingosinicella microcystinivorans]|uniref:Uncharacterized protein n=1 Tax=Sphingosinicella microcystinivorans TaxID=335406 RepID=A0AAD1D478_SPHMI|nr:hypothetical protein SmB9_07350 [Sphingosinicella microcystinivorans]
MSFAESVVAKRFDDAAIGRQTAPAVADQAHQFVTKSEQMLNLGLDPLKMATGDAVGCRTFPVWMVRQVKKRANVFDGEAKFTRMTYERESCSV